MSLSRYESVFSDVIKMTIISPALISESSSIVSSTISDTLFEILTKNSNVESLHETEKQNIR